MEFGDLLKVLSIDAWYKAVMLLGGAVFVASIFYPAHGLTNLQLQILSCGAFLVGLGEWKNHKEKSWIKPPNVYTGPAAFMSGTVREPDLLGRLFVLAGVALILLGAWKIIRG